MTGKMPHFPTSGPLPRTDYLTRWFLTSSEVSRSEEKHTTHRKSPELLLRTLDFPSVKRMKMVGR